MPPLQALEDRPAKDGPHHGHLFVVATFSILVNAQIAAITVGDLDPQVWAH
jgi:hypothetical protein